MNFNLTEEQLGLEDTLQRFLNRDYTFEKRRALLANEDGFSRSAWATYAELGILALPFPEEFGGLDGTAVDTYLVMRTLGKGLILEPYLSTIVLCGGVISGFATQAQKQVLIPSLASGESLLALAHYEPQSRYNESLVETQAVAQGDGWVLSGHKAVVLGAPSADHFLVSARLEGDSNSEEGVSLFLVPADASGLSINSWVNHDGTRAGDVVLQQVKVNADQLIGEQGKAIPAIRQAIALANSAMAAETTGIMRALIAATLEYLKTRQQFGVPLSTFQALQHRLADMAIAAEQADSMALRAAIEMQNQDPTARLRQASGAKTYVDQQARLVGQDAVQLHGGIGVTDELDVAHYFKRLTTLSLMFGDAAYHLQRYSDMLETANEQ
ncbi:acyl-CoA dehydrogenase family protein [Pusillimonas sp. ANT_WB101]|uniref:acyl-CoA dehydrogenase family protein n=1 Tax=Pusillimonas sp. ANT_WB101 TaxID=2597356 RepID=UPI0011ED3542|nr:acyl-CoA dehydrogenase family protein [Pusillimonas sp. ANT_WB101]KAA0911236.1 pimeloyl-CoA dehydrogenase small subunit [Pusillimonas sp. ANT_WB101]